MNITTWRILKKLQSIYNIMIVNNGVDARIFIVDLYTPSQNQIPDTLVKGREITHLITDNSMAMIINVTEGVMTIDEKQAIFTKIESIPSMSYRFSHHYKWELWETN